MLFEIDDIDNGNRVEVSGSGGGETCWVIVYGGAIKMRRVIVAAVASVLFDLI